jgi:hypothetical protein
MEVLFFLEMIVLRASGSMQTDFLYNIWFKSTEGTNKCQNFNFLVFHQIVKKKKIAKCSSLSQYRKWVIFLWKRSKMKPKFQSFLYLENINHYFFFIFDILDRAHVGGWRRRLVKVDFTFSLVKSEVQVALSGVKKSTGPRSGTGDLLGSDLTFLIP